VVAAHVSADREALLDWNESPIGPPALAVKRVMDAAERLHRYPRGLMAEVTALTADHACVTPDQVLLTAGIDEAVDLTLSMADRAWGLWPGFDGYQDRAAANGKSFHRIDLDQRWQPPARPPAELGDGDILYLAQPGNPIGTSLPDEWIDAASAEYLLVDETYQDFASRPSALTRPARPGRLVYRSFSKAAGLAGIRIGYLVGDPATIAGLAPLRRFMPIDAVSLNAAAGLLEDPDFMARLTAHVRQARPALCAVLRDSGLFAEVRECETNFVLARPMTAARGPLTERLDHDLVRVKDCAVLGLPGWLRISVGSWDDQTRLADALARVTTTEKG
jgi:histidinol-phosphate/aromatic aminotransferase/cobyric acid decarboxylase-like protein